MKKFTLQLNFIFTLILTIILYSCKGQNHNMESIALKLKNNELHYLFPSDSSTFSVSFTNEKNRLLSTNEIVFEIINNTDQKILFMVNDKNLIDIYNINIKIFENDSLIKGRIIMADPVFDDPASDSIYRQKLIKITDKLLEKDRKLIALGAKANLDMFNAFVNQSVVVDKNESKTFKSLFKFPYTCEPLIDEITPFGFRIKKNKRYSFSIEYQVDIKDVEKELTRKQLDSLKKENIVIFSGKLISNKIPLINKYE